MTSQHRQLDEGIFFFKFLMCSWRYLYSTYFAIDPSYVSFSQIKRETEEVSPLPVEVDSPFLEPFVKSYSKCALKWKFTLPTTFFVLRPVRGTNITRCTFAITLFLNQDANFPVQEPLMAWPEDFIAIKNLPKLTMDDLAITDSFTPGMNMAVMNGLRNLRRQKNNTADLLPAFFAYIFATISRVSKQRW